VGTGSKPGVEPHKSLGPDTAQVGYKYEEAVVSYQPVRNASWDGMKLKLENVQIPQRSSVFFFLSRVPAVIRSIEGRDVMWPVSSQPHLRIEWNTDGTLLIRNDYHEAVLSVSPDWLSSDFEAQRTDEKTGWPSFTVNHGTWRLTRQGQILYDSRKLPWPAHIQKSLVAAIQPITTGKRVPDSAALGADHRLVLQNGLDGYQGQSNEQMTTGQWGGEVGADSHGPDGLFLFSSEEHDRYAVDLIRFELAGKLSKEATVTRAVLLLHAEKEGSGNHASAYKVLQPWVDGKTWWNNWGHGGSDAGYVETKPAFTARLIPQGDTFFVVDPTLIQQWADDPSSNHGVLLKAHDGGANFHWWADGDKGDHPPQLIIEYNVQ